MINEELFKIYFIEYDADGNEIRRGVHLGKKYKTYRGAEDFAYKTYGDLERFDLYIATREPWGVYENEAVCDLCGSAYTRPENHYGIDSGISFSIDDRRGRAHFITRRERLSGESPVKRTYNRYDICPACYEKLIAFIEKEKKDR